MDQDWAVSAGDFVTQCLTGNKSSHRLDKEKIIGSFFNQPGTILNSGLDNHDKSYWSRNGCDSHYQSNIYQRSYSDAFCSNDDQKCFKHGMSSNCRQERVDNKYEENGLHNRNRNLERYGGLRNISPNDKMFYQGSVRYVHNDAYGKNLCSRKNICTEKNYRPFSLHKSVGNNINDVQGSSSKDIFQSISKTLHNFDNKQTSTKPRQDISIPRIFLENWQSNQYEDKPEFVEDLEKYVQMGPSKIQEEEKKWTISNSSYYEMCFQSAKVWKATDECKKLCKMFDDLINQKFRQQDTEKKTETLPCKSYSSMSEGDDDDSESGSSITDEEIKERDRVIKTLQLKQKHPNRLHPELWFNDPGELNDGYVCRCSVKARKWGIRHNIFAGEHLIEKCDLYSNNADKLYHYRVVISPSTNIFIKMPTAIKFDCYTYSFEGFSLFSHFQIPKLPACKVIRFNICYSILYVPEDAPQNFCVHELDLFSEYFFREILEMVDFNLYPHDQTKEGCPVFHFMPRFVRPVTDAGFELLPMCEVIKHLVESMKPLIHPKDLVEISQLDNITWQNRISHLKGMVVTKPEAKPRSVRVDQLDKDISDHPDNLYPDIVHFGLRPSQLSYAGNKRYLKLWKSYIKYRHLLANLPKPTAEDKRQLQEKEEALRKIKTKSKMKRGVTVVLSSRGFLKTGIMCDMVQHALLLPVLVCYLRFHHSLNSLEERIGYTFKDRYLLQLSLTHPSYRENFGTNPDHVRNALSNCGIRQPEYGDRRIHYQNNRKRGINTLINIMSKFGKNCEMPSSVTHNERLEFLGDAVIELITTVHLYFLFPEIEEGGLATYRAAIVQNQNLTVLARTLNLERYMLFAHGPDLCHDFELRHALANCFEALMAAVYLDGGLEVTDKMFSQTFLFDKKDLLDVWMNYPKHPIQEQEPDGDRKWIPRFPLLQRLTKLEESIGIKFTHIRLLARAFTDRSIGYTNLTLGSNQRMEFLGDTVLQLICSTYLYKHFPDHHEGHLSLLRSSLVNNRTQSIVCDDLSLSSYALLANTKDVHKIKDRADILEAFLGALYIDKGMEYCVEFCDVCFFPRLQEFIVNQHWNDPKSKLQQCCLTLRNVNGREPDIPVYKVIECKGPTNGRVYKVAVYFKGERLASANGHNIQEAEMNAAKQALAKSRDLFPRLTHQKRQIHKNIYKSHADPRSNFINTAATNSNHTSRNDNASSTLGKLLHSRK